MANLRDHIKTEIEKGRLKELFSVGEIKALTNSQGRCTVGGGNYDPRWVNSILANHSTGPGTRIGESVKRGEERLFKKHEKRGVYSLEYEDFDLNIEDLSSLLKPETNPEKKSLGISECAGAAKKIVDYLREKPFRTLRAEGIWHPTSAVTGWKNRLHQYDWNGNNLATTQIKVNKFINDIVNLQKKLKTNVSKTITIEQEAKIIYDEIRQWGNPRGVKRSGACVLNFLKNVWNNQITNIDSTLTKLYAFACPHDYVIYDSRVAAAIMTIAEDIYRIRQVRISTPDGPKSLSVDTIINFQRTFPNLGLYGGQGGTRPRGYRSTAWPNAYGHVKAQYDANRLCKCIVDVLNELKEDGRQWSLREVESVLFMEGY